MIYKGEKFSKIYVELWFLFSAHPLMMVYICTKFHEYILNGISYRADMISKGNNSVKL